MGKFVLPGDLSGTLKPNLGVGLEKKIGLEETQSLCGFLNNIDIGKPWWQAEPRDKSCLVPYVLNCIICVLLDVLGCVFVSAGTLWTCH